MPFVSPDCLPVQAQNAAPDLSQLPDIFGQAKDAADQAAGSAKGAADQATGSAQGASGDLVGSAKGAANEAKGAASGVGQKVGTLHSPALECTSAPVLWLGVADCFVEQQQQPAAGTGLELSTPAPATWLGVTTGCRLWLA